MKNDSYITPRADALLAKTEDTYDLAKRLGYHAVKLDKPEVSEATIGGKVYRSELWYYIADRDGKPASRNWHTEDLAWEHFEVERHLLVLEDVRDKMRTWAGDSSDLAHSMGDGLLLVALAALRNEETETVITQITEAYLKIGKGTHNQA